MVGNRRARLCLQPSSRASAGKLGQSWYAASQFREGFVLQHDTGSHVPCSWEEKRHFSATLQDTWAEIALLWAGKDRKC